MNLRFLEALKGHCLAGLQKLLYELSYWVIYHSLKKTLKQTVVLRKPGTSGAGS